jgi:hypothetical protein
MFKCHLDEFHNTKQRQGLIPTLDQTEGPNIALTPATTTNEDYCIVIRKLAWKTKT